MVSAVYRDSSPSSTYIEHPHVWSDGSDHRTSVDRVAHYAWSTSAIAVD